MDFLTPKTMVSTPKLQLLYDEKFLMYNYSNSNVLAAILIRRHDGF